MSARPASVLSPPVAILPGTLASTLARGTTNAHSPGVKPAAPDRTICSNSEYSFPLYPFVNLPSTPLPILPSFLPSPGVCRTIKRPTRPHPRFRVHQSIDSSSSLLLRPWTNIPSPLLGCSACNLKHLSPCFRFSYPQDALLGLLFLFLSFLEHGLLVSFTSEHPFLMSSFGSYRIHLSPGSRRTSASATRAAMNRAMGASGLPRTAPRDGQRKRGKSSSSSTVDLFPENSSSPPIHPPSLAPAHHPLAIPVHAPEPPNTPPPLSEARLSLYSSHPTTHPISYFSPASHIPLNTHSHPGSPAILNSNLTSVPSQWNYRGHSVASLSEHEHRPVPSHSPSYDFTDPEQAPSPSSSASSQQHPQTPSYSFSSQYPVEERGAGCNPHSVRSHSSSSVYPQEDGVHQNSLTGPLSFGSHSRHSIAHISHPRHSPSSIHSISPSPSHPPTPTFPSSSYNASDLDGPASGSLSHQNPTGSILDTSYGTSGLSDTTFTNSPTSYESQGLPLPDYSTPPSPSQHHYASPYSQTQSVQSQYSTHGRFPSPPVVLAPIQSDRIRGDIGQTIRRRTSSSDGHSILHSSSSSQHLSFPRIHNLQQNGVSSSPPPGSQGSNYVSSVQHSQSHFIQPYPSLGGDYPAAECRMDNIRYRGELVQ